MSRGPAPLKAQEESLLIAEKRGHVQRYLHRIGNICDFTVMCPGLVVFVCAMRLIRLSSTPEDIAHDFAQAIGRLRFVASSPAISRELWLRTPRGAWRFFRILDESIRELAPNGMPLAHAGGPVPCTAPASGKGTQGMPGSAGQNGKKTGAPVTPVVPAPQPEIKPVPGKDPATPIIAEKNSAPDPGREMPEETTAQSTDDPIPGLIRKFLKRRTKGLDKDPEAP